MLCSASLHRLPKSASKVSFPQTKRCVRISASATDSTVQAEAPRVDSGRPRDAHHLATCISAIAAQFLAANVVLAEVPNDEVFSLQAAQPLTELSSYAPEGARSDDAQAAAVAELSDVVSLDSNAPPGAIVAVTAEEPASAETDSPSIELASAPALLVISEAAVETPAEFANVAVVDAVVAAESAAEPAGPVAEAVLVEETGPALLEAVALTAEPAVASPVIAMDIPAMPAINADTNLQTLVSALIRNEQFIAALVNNEAFLDRLAGEDRVVEELARRKGLSIEVETRDELATELRRRQQMIDALAARGEEAVLAVADAAKAAAEEAAAAARSETKEADVTGEVGVVSSGKSALVAMETAVELLEDSQELLAAVEANPGSTPLSAFMGDDRKLKREFSKMEAAVARAEKSVSKTLEKNAAESLPDIQEAVRELYAAEQQQQQQSNKAPEPQDDVTINRAYTDLVTAVAEMQRAYGTAISKAVGHAVAEVVEVEEAAVQGAEKTKVLMSQKVEEVEKAVGFNPAAPRASLTKERPAVATADKSVKDAADQDAGANGLKVAVVGAFLFWFWGTFIQPRSRYSR